jgi:Cu-processing system permease protein
MTAVIVTARGALREALQSWWVTVYAVTFGVLALGLAALGGNGSGSLGFESFNRTSASLLNVCLLLAPLIGLALGASAVAGERERGTLHALLAQPVARWEFLLGLYLGLLGALAVATGVGFGVAGIVLAMFAPLIDAGRYLLLFVLVLTLAGVMLALGLLISVLAENRLRALGAAIAVWFALVLVLDLGLIGMTLTGMLGSRGLAVSLLLNPVEIARTLAILSLEPSLDVLGPAGVYLATVLGAAGAAAVLALALAGWLALPLAGAAAIFRRQDV